MSVWIMCIAPINVNFEMFWRKMKEIVDCFAKFPHWGIKLVYFLSVNEEENFVKVFLNCFVLFLFLFNTFKFSIYREIFAHGNKREKNICMNIFCCYISHFDKYKFSVYLHKMELLHRNRKPTGKKPIGRTPPTK